MRRGCAGAAACVLTAASLAGAAHAAPDLAQAEAAVVAQANRFRAAHAVPAVDRAPALDRAARAFAQFMAGTDRYGHNADARTPSQRAAAAGYAYCMVSENIAYEFNSEGFDTLALAAGFAQGWEASPPHRANLLGPMAVDTGVAIARSGRTGRYYAVQMFGRPAARSIRFEVNNPSGRTMSYTLDGRPQDLPARSTRTHRSCRVPALLLPAADGRQQQVPARDGERYVLPVP